MGRAQASRRWRMIIVLAIVMFILLAMLDHEREKK